MPFAVQLVQAVLFTPEGPSPFELFSIAFGVSPTQFQAAQPPATGSVAMAVVNGRTLLVQFQQGRVDLFVASVDPTVPTESPGQFNPISDPAGAIDLAVASAGKLAANLKIVSRLAVVLRYVESVPNMESARRSFSDVTGLSIERVGTTGNILQTGETGTLAQLPGSLLNCLRRWQTETIYTVNIGLADGVPGALPRIEHHAVTLNADANVIPADGVIPLPMVGDLLHRLREIAIDVGGMGIPEGVQA